MKLMERKYISKNGVVERTRYAVGDNAKPRRGKRRGNTSFRKQEQNFNSALRRMARILNCNYSHDNGLLITLDYDRDGLEKLIAELREKQREIMRELRCETGKIGTWTAGKSKDGGKHGRLPRRFAPRNDRDGGACGKNDGDEIATAQAPRNDKIDGACTAAGACRTPYRETQEIATAQAPCNDKIDGACLRAADSRPYGGDIEDAVAEALAAVRAAADKQMSLWLRRVKRKYAAQGGTAKIKALMITSDIDHETGELVRIHHHLVLAVDGGISWDLLQKEWKLGSVDIRQLRAQPDYTPIATYLMRQVRRQPDAKKYRVTQGMELPQVEERVILSHSEIRAPAGANVLERSEFSVECIGQYIRYVPKKREKKRKQVEEQKEGAG